VPLRGTEPVALPPSVTAADRAPRACGVNTTSNVQDPAMPSEPAPEGGEQLSLVTEKSFASVPVTVRLVMVKVAVPVFVSVTVWAALGLPNWLVKVKLAGVKEATGATPVPERPTVWEPGGASSVTVTDAVRVPKAVGLKATTKSQDAPMARIPGAGHGAVPALIWKSPGLAPVSEMLAILSAAVLPGPLVSVTVWLALVLPTGVPAKVALAGASVTTGETPVADRSTVKSEDDALSAMTS
jgi:hypothetical protein